MALMSGPFGPESVNVTDKNFVLASEDATHPVDGL